MTAPAITYNAETRDYAVTTDDGQLIGITRTADAAETLRDEWRHQQALIDAGTPAIDCADLRAALKAGPVLAAALLGRLTRPQLVVQANAYAAYLSELHNADVSGAQVLTNFERGLANYGVANHD